VGLPALVRVPRPGGRNAILHEHWASMWEMVVIAFVVVVPIAFLVVWRCGYPAVRLVSSIVRRIFGRPVPVEQWDRATSHALWPLPWAAGLGVLTWTAYSAGRYYGWSADFVFGVIVNAIGAWCYLTILFAWWRMTRQPADATP